MQRSFELTTRIGKVQRSKGRSAVAAAAYKAGADYYDERDKELKAYSRKAGVVYSRVFVPQGAPDWALDAQALWNACELAERNKDARAGSEWKDKAQTAGELLYTYPDELSAEGRRKVAERIARYLVERDGAAVQASIHAPGRDGDSRNWHCHIQMTTRVLTSKGLGRKAEGQCNRDLGQRQSKELRAFIAQALNEELAKEGKAGLVKVEHKSFKARGVARQPTRHQGPKRTHIKRNQLRAEREAWARAKASEQKEKQDKEAASLKIRQDFERQKKRAELQRRYLEFTAAIRAQLRSANQADRPPTGLRRAFLIATGQFRKVESGRRERIKERTQEARHRVETMRKALGMEARSFERGQQIQREDLKQRHEAENRQLNKATEIRADLDRIREQQARRAEVTRSQGKEREQGRERTLEFG